MVSRTPTAGAIHGRDYDDRGCSGEELFQVHAVGGSGAVVMRKGLHRV
jgi:hypothetical protein